MTGEEIKEQVYDAFTCDDMFYRPELRDAIYDMVDENANLRELVRDMWFWRYEGHMDGKSQEWQMRHIDGVLERMRELGIEVDDDD